MGLGNAYTQPLGYVIIQIQVYGVHGYDEDQIVLVVLDESKFVEQIPVILGTPHHKPCCEHYERKRNRCLGDALGQCQGGASPISMQSNDHDGGG